MRINNFSKLLVLLAKISIILFIAIFNAQANQTSNINQSSHCNTLKGWHFYCEEKQQDEEKEVKSEVKPKLTPEKSDAYYLEQIEAIKQRVEVLKAKMIIEPTEENIKNYISYQGEVLNRASFVTDAWQRTIWQNPNLDYTLKRPVSKIGKETYLDAKQEEKRILLNDLSKRYGVFFVFRSDCPYCHKFAPIMKMLEAKGFNIIPISLDGGFLPEFPANQTKTNTGQLSKFGIEIEAVPAVFLFDAKTNEVITIGFGFIAFDELEERIYMLTSKGIGEDY